MIIEQFILFFKFVLKLYWSNKSRKEKLHEKLYSGNVCIN